MKFLFAWCRRFWHGNFQANWKTTISILYVLAYCSVFWRIRRHTTREVSQITFCKIFKPLRSQDCLVWFAYHPCSCWSRSIFWVGRPGTDSWGWGKGDHARDTWHVVALKSQLRCQQIKHELVCLRRSGAHAKTNLLILLTNTDYLTLLNPHT